MLKRSQAPIAAARTTRITRTGIQGTGAQSRSPLLLWRQMRRWLLYSGAAVLVTGPTVIAFFSGGFFDRPRLIAAVVTWALVAVVAVAAPRPLPASGPSWLALAGLCLLTAWTAAAMAWGP